MTNDEKRLLKQYIKWGWSFRHIQLELGCSNSTIKKYMKQFRPKKGKKNAG